MKFAVAAILAIGAFASDAERRYSSHHPSSYSSSGSASRSYGSSHNHGYTPSLSSYGELYSRLHSLESRVEHLESNEVILDFFETNSNPIVVGASGSSRLTDSWCVLKGQSVDIQVQVSANVGDLDLEVVLNDTKVVARSNESEDSGSNDTTSQSVIFRITCKEDGEFYIRLNNGTASNQTIGAHHLQIGVKIYNHGYEVTDHLPDECPEHKVHPHYHAHYASHSHYKKPVHSHYAPSYSAHYKPYGHYAH